MPWTSLVNALFLPGKKILGSTGMALRDNAIAIAEGASGAPITAAGWHPYNRTTVGGAETGVIYDFAVDGAQATVTSPDFADGYEYMFIFDRIRSSSATAGAIEISLWRETTGAYAGGGAISGVSLTTTQSVSGYAYVMMPRQVSRQHQVHRVILVEAANSVTTGDSISITTTKHTTAQKILRARFALSTGSITGNGSDGKIFMYRRLSND